MEKGHGPRETKRLKRSHAEAKADSGPVEAPARQAAAAVSAEDDLLLLEAGGSAEAALLELQVPARCHARLTQPGRGVCHSACCTRCRRVHEPDRARAAGRSVLVWTGLAPPLGLANRAQPRGRSGAGQGAGGGGARGLCARGRAGRARGPAPRRADPAAGGGAGAGRRRRLCRRAGRAPGALASCEGPGARRPGRPLTARARPRRSGCASGRRRAWRWWAATFCARRPGRTSRWTWRSRRRRPASTPRTS